jgi:SAM-dependent methyltransferase
MNLNLGSGDDFRYEKDWINLDLTTPCSVIADVTKPLPFKNNCLDMVWASHILEHIPDLCALQLELARIIKRKGELNIIVPYYLSPDAWGNPTHCRSFSEESFLICFWPGFTIVNLELKTYMKRGTGNKVVWIHVKMVRNEMDFWEVKRDQARSLRS